MTGLLATAPALPLLLAAVARRDRLWWTPALGALPALGAALLVPLDTRLEIPWLLLGTVLELDATGRVFLSFSAILWTVAGVHGASTLRGTAGAGRFRTLFLLALAGNLLLILGQDLVSFYTGFSLMGIAAYGLVAHGGSAEARRAGRVYLTMTVAAELALFCALVLIAHQAGGLTPTPAQLTGLDDLTMALLVLGLGIKAGLVPLHLWVPLAYPAAPAAAAAVLSGAMSKVALLGWLRFLPLGQAASPGWGALLLLLGLASLVVALPVGLVQSDPRAVLAYSSIAKAGLLALTLGLVLMEPALAPTAVAALALYAAHHGLVKGALFLGVELRQQSRLPTLVLAGLAFLALAMAGAPLTSGAVAKYGIKAPLDATAWAWLGAFAAASATAMALLMARFMWSAWRIPYTPAHAGTWPLFAWSILITLVALFPFVLGPPAAWMANLLPVAAALLIALPFALAAQRRPSLFRPLAGQVPPGDLLTLIGPVSDAYLWLAGSLFGHWLRLVKGARGRLASLVGFAGRPDPDTERLLRTWPLAGALWLALLALMLIVGPLKGPLGWRQ